MRSQARIHLAVAALAIVVLAGCGGGDDDGASTAARPAATSPASTPTPTPTPARPLGDEWYADDDGNGVPNFIESQIGSDPASDDCLNKTGCDRRLVDEGLKLVEQRNNTMLLLDSSGSMAASAGGGQSKMDVAKDAIARHVEVMPSAIKLGFEVFGHRGANTAAEKATSCRGVDVLARPGELRKGSVDRVLARFQPRGYTPLAAALRRVRGAFAGQEDASNRVILVTDGVETCGRDPVAAARALHESGVAVTVDVVGFDVGSADAARLRRIAEASGGSYTDARSGAQLQAFFEAERRRLRRIEAAFQCLVRARDAQLQCAAAERDAALKAMSDARDKAVLAGDDAKGAAIGKIIDKALEQRAGVIERRLERNKAAIDKLLEELRPLRNAAYDGRPCLYLRRVT